MRGVVAALLLSGFAVVLTATPAAAHVVPSSVVSLDVHADNITAALTLPAADLATASGITVTEGAPPTEQTAAALAGYLTENVRITSPAGPWTVAVGDVTTTDTQQWGTGSFSAVTATLTLTPPDAASLRAFILDYDVIVHQVVTADVYVVLHSDWAAGEVGAARTLGLITTDTRTGAVPVLTVDLADGSAWQGFAGMVSLGISHIAEGTDHQLFLLTLLLPAPLLAAAGRWRDVAGRRSAVGRITRITLAFTAGHSLTLLLGTLGLPVPQQPVEAAIAVSILVAAAHAVRPLFPGREAVVAGLFGLVHGMAFSTTLAEMDLSGGQLALSLLGFNLGIELMQLAVVLLVLPPLVVLARTPGYRPLRVGAAVITGIAAVGWLLDRLGLPTVLSTAADSLWTVSPWIVAALWLAAVAVLLRMPRAGRPEERPVVTHHGAA